ncbi:Exodeoxyribonuclease 7 large subunit [Frankliniella fusca]|uniref:ATP-dependent DNA helicase n=1 Tax=Frankliniella fusca TaxID=407009 RepID=A0AAE1LEY0_9NEOP|nr:Exodeoxyribonuclease 7 large subunit [Frankliniella fusca]
MLTGKEDVLCGGKVVLFGGDLGQVLPVIDGVPPTSVDHYSLPAWDHWQSLQPLSLTYNMRAANDPDFSNWLSIVRDGTANLGNRDIYLPRDVVLDGAGSAAVPEENLMRSMVQEIFVNFDEDHIKSGIILTPTNDVVRKINRVVLSKMPGIEKSYFSKTTLVFEDGNEESEGFQMAQEELDLVSPTRLPPHRLDLKKGSLVMLLQNFSKRQALCNGTRFVVRSI